MADTLDVLSLAEGKAAVLLDPGDSADNDVLAGYITAVSRLLDREAGPVVRRAVEGERHSGGRHKIVLRHRPVAEVTEVTEWDGTTSTVLAEETPGVRPADGWLGDDYQPDPQLLNGVLRRRSSGCDWPWAAGRRNVVVDYVAGRYPDTASVDVRFKRAAAITLENLWRDRQPGVIEQDPGFAVPHQSFPGFALPNAARELLGDELGLGGVPWGFR